MTKVTLITAAGRKSDIFEETKTPKEILEYFDVDYAVATNSLDGVRLDIAGMNKSLRELGVGKECRLSSIVKIDNAAKVVVVGSAAILTSDVKLEDWKRIQKVEPADLTLVDEDTEEVVFRVGIDEGPGSVNEYGVMFGSTVDKDGKAQATVLLDPAIEDKLGTVRENLGPAVLMLNQLEAEVPGILGDIAKKEEEINEHIVLM